MQWVVTETYPDLADSANEIIAWINTNGGEARYEPHATNPAIAVRMADGLDYARPGYYIMMGYTSFADPYQPLGVERFIRNFFPCSQTKFERQWKRSNGVSPQEVESVLEEFRKSGYDPDLHGGLYGTATLLIGLLKGAKA